MRVATLVIITRECEGVKQVLIACKKTGEIGIGKYSLPGGKLDPGETIRECAARETLEEMAILLPEQGALLKEVALLDVFVAKGSEPYKHFMRVFVYRTSEFLGEPVETIDMEQPLWVPYDDIPYKHMYAGDERWMPFVLLGEAAELHFSIYRSDESLSHIRLQVLQPFDELMPP